MKMNWFILAIVSMVGFTFMNLLFKKALNVGVKSEILVFYVFGIGTLISLAYLLSIGESLEVTKVSLSILAAAALFSIVSNVILTQSIKIAPNPGYALAVNSAQILLVTVASYFIFKSDFTLIKGVGAVLTVIGLVLLGL